ncbi:hypothetical protein VOLCADRAFT_103523 [Volvox carteri f. nagariensis]|uniref:Uncharacterized protein n=1 Tax=Volvox carteri f. nagariensis TaxID=3068 RepID=D8TMF0_VOLCA|nr:uncharacterized protein VOLCADRAFT_103523 [Volvox carteri f. nagariensis]EFJ51114.1 hypothetical protein VOLCADRAFT_103523 [Volvox carteri f. nagariensis]|eukprot:XP_002947581.1 hypothetical protein VOLCADRAFT_103523 [Volvox carteri f. nagariensis]
MRSDRGKLRGPQLNFVERGMETRYCCYKGTAISLCDPTNGIRTLIERSDKIPKGVVEEIACFWYNNSVLSPLARGSVKIPGIVALYFPRRIVQKTYRQLYLDFLHQHSTAFHVSFGFFVGAKPGTPDKLQVPSQTQSHAQIGPSARMGSFTDVRCWVSVQHLLTAVSFLIYGYMVMIVSTSPKTFCGGCHGYKEQVEREGPYSRSGTRLHTHTHTHVRIPLVGSQSEIAVTL